MLKYANIAIPLLIILPNLLWAVFPAIDAPAPQSRAAVRRFWTAMEGLERVGQIGVFMLPLFLRVEIEKVVHKAALAVMIGALLLYYICWVRFFRSGRRNGLLCAPLGFIPSPMAVCPIIYFLASALLLDSWLLLSATLVFAIGHLAICRRDYAITKDL